MAISIIVEDGSNVTNANSFVTLAEVRAYAEQRGATVPANDDALGAMVINACDYLEAQANRFQGDVSNEGQSLQWPRTGVYVGNSETELASNVIPKQLKSAQCATVLALNEGVDILPNYSASDFVVREKVGPIETEYADPSKVGITPTLTNVEALLQPLFGSTLTGFALRTMRV